jgi:hypothetical protein
MRGKWEFWFAWYPVQATADSKLHWIWLHYCWRMRAVERTYYSI